MNILLMMMGGSGTRFGANVPKQFVELENRPIFTYAVEAYQKCEFIDRIVIVSHKNWLDYVKAWCGWLEANKVCVITEGGDNRSASVRNGLKAMVPFAADDDVILIHDATHPYCDREGTLGVIEGVKEYGGATLGQCQFDTVYEIGDDGMLKKVIKRQNVVSGASPEAFRYQIIRDIYFAASEAELEQMTSAGTIALAHNIPMKVVPAAELNLKITYPHDMEIFILLLKDFFPDAKPCTPEEKPM